MQEQDTGLRRNDNGIGRKNKMKKFTVLKGIASTLPKDKAGILMEAVEEFSFETDGFRKHRLVNGLEHEAAITGFEKQQKGSQSWLYKQ